MRGTARCGYRYALAVLAIVLTGCGMAQQMPSFDTFSHRISDGTVALYWNCNHPGGGAVQVSGWANNPYGPGPIQELEFILYGVNAQGGTVAQAKGNAQAFQIQTNEPAPFTVEYRTLGGEARYDLVYQYYASGGGGGRGGMRAGGMGERQQNLVRDACAGMAP